MKMIIEDGKASEFFYEGDYYKTNREIDVTFAEGMRMQRVFGVRCKILEKLDAPYQPSYFASDRKVAMIADINSVSGWGDVGLNLIKYSRAFIETSLIGNVNRVDEPFISAARNRGLHPDMGVVIHEQPKEEWLSLPFERRIAVVPFETTRVPDSWVHRLNACKALITPCRQNIKMFEDSGVTVPIELMHWGIDPKKFYKIERPERDTFTFGIMGSLTKRKGIDILVDAFFKAFPHEKDVRLLCKSSNNFFLWGVRDPRMKIDLTPVSHEEIMEGFFKQIDCFVLPTHGEGAGIPIIEAQATGVPVIATGWSGPLDYMTEDTGWFIDYTMDQAEDFSKNVYKEDCGQWSVPKVVHLIYLLRYAYEHREKVRQKGENALRYVAQNRTWEITIKDYVRILEKYF